MRTALEQGEPEPTVTAKYATEALDDLLHTGQQLTRSLLGVGNDPQTLPVGGGIGILPPERRPGRRMIG